VAYRKLFGVALVALGALAAGCGGGEGRNVVDADDDGSLPPVSDDQAPWNPDRPRTNGDQAAPSSDQPSRNPDQPDSPGGVVSGGGGSLEDLCETVCAAAQACNDTDTGEGIQNLCSTACTIPEGATAPTSPCQRELVSLLGCAFDASGGQCPTEANEAALQAQCADAGRAYTGCLQAVDDGDDNDNDPEPMPAEGNCTKAGGCQNCPNACATCACAATGNQEATVTCLMSDACTNP
jgi:hypothetical protein